MKAERDVLRDGRAGLLVEGLGVQQQQEEGGARLPVEHHRQDGPIVSSVSGSNCTDIGYSVRAIYLSASRETLTFAFAPNSGVVKKETTRLKRSRHGSVANSAYLMRPSSLFSS